MPTSAPERPALLQVDSLVAGYGKIIVLHGVDLVVNEAEIVAVTMEVTAYVATL